MKKIWKRFKENDISLRILYILWAVLLVPTLFFGAGVRKMSASGGESEGLISTAMDEAYKVKDGPRYRTFAIYVQPQKSSELTTDLSEDVILGIGCDGGENFKKKLQRQVRESLTGEQEKYSEDLCCSFSSFLSATIESETGKLETETVLYGGDFYFFHPYPLVNGVWAGENSNQMTVINRTLAFALFGSYEAEGMKVKIGGNTYTVAGVVDDSCESGWANCPVHDREEPEDTSASYRNERPVLYLPMNCFEKKAAPVQIECFECMIPEQLAHMAGRTIDGAMNSREKNRYNSYSAGYEVISKSEYFSRKNVVKENDGIVFPVPFWENAVNQAQKKANVRWNHFAAFSSAWAVVTGILATSLFIRLRKQKTE